MLCDTTQYRPKPFISGSIKNHGVASTLWAFKPSAPRLQHPGSRSATNLVHHRNAIVSFFRTRSRSLSLACQARLSGNCMQPPKPLNNMKFYITTTHLGSPFHPGTAHVGDIGEAWFRKDMVNTSICSVQGYTRLSRRQSLLKMFAVQDTGGNMLHQCYNKTLLSPRQNFEL